MHLTLAAAGSMQPLLASVLLSLITAWIVV
jgi:hypothetical protein